MLNCFLLGFAGAVAGLLFVNWIAPWWYSEQIRHLKDRIKELESGYNV